MPDEKSADISDLMDALGDVSEAKGKLQEAESEYTGYSPSYHLSSWYEALEKAKERAKQSLDVYIAARVEEVLRARK